MILCCRRKCSWSFKSKGEEGYGFLQRDADGLAWVKMREDNTPTVTSRRRQPTPHMRLRLETAKRLQKLGARAKAKRKVASQTEQTTGETNMISTTPRPPRVEKGRLSKPPKAESKFRKRQIHKSWLPTHLYHAKRAHMTLPKEPLWRFAIPLTPTEKSYRATHRAMGARGCVAWDMSYMGTIGVEGAEASLMGLLTAMGLGEDMAKRRKGEKWRKGTRAWEGWLSTREGDQRALAPVSIIWCAILEEPSHIETAGAREENGERKEKRKLFIRVQPSAFLQLWNEVLKVAKIQRPPAMVEDLRFEVGSIEITGPGSTEALIGALRPTAANSGGDRPGDCPSQIWSSLGSITNPASLPANVLLGFDVSDPRLRHPPRTVPQPTTANANDDLLQLRSVWPPDSTQSAPALFDRNARFTASRCLPSQKSINRRKGDAPPGTYPTPLPTDPNIPVLLLASRPESASGQGSWTLLLPRKCVLPVWYSLMHYPLSSGGNPRFGGLREKRQIAFEQGVPWFPGDYPGTKSGWEWELTEQGKRKAEWEKRPKGKRIEWDSLDLGLGRRGEIGRGWACDWQRLFQGPQTTVAGESVNNATTTDEAEVPPVSTAPAAPASAPTVTEPSATPLISPSLSIRHIPSSLATSLLKSTPISTPPAQLSTALTTVKVTLISRGTPTSCARIYRLPNQNPALRAQWLALALPTSSKCAKNKPPPRAPPLPLSAPPHLRRQQLASSLLSPHPLNRIDAQKLIPQAGDSNYPAVPGEEDLIGFVTTGNFNLGEGRGTGIGCIALARVVGQTGREARLCVVREAGVAVGRLARWEVA